MTVRRHWHFVSRMTPAEWLLHIRVVQAVGRIEFILGKPPRGKQIHIDMETVMISDWPAGIPNA